MSTKSRRTELDNASKALRETLAERYPAVFTWPPTVPLAIGIHQAISEATGVDPKVVGHHLRFWTRQLTYQRRLAAGDQRRNLDGSLAADPIVTEEQREAATQQIRDAMATIRGVRQPGKKSATTPT